MPPTPLHPTLMPVHPPCSCASLHDHPFTARFQCLARCRACCRSNGLHDTRRASLPYPAAHLAASPPHHRLVLAILNHLECLDWQPRLAHRSRGARLRLRAVGRLPRPRLRSLARLCCRALARRSSTHFIILVSRAVSLVPQPCTPERSLARATLFARLVSLAGVRARARRAVGDAGVSAGTDAGKLASASESRPTARSRAGVCEQARTGAKGGEGGGRVTALSSRGLARFGFPAPGVHKRGARVRCGREHARVPARPTCSPSSSLSFLCVCRVPLALALARLPSRALCLLTDDPTMYTSGWDSSAPESFVPVPVR
ncbi:hypothetical protein FRC08_013688 [Ceratobasidium sp. 394]|nr:hypothetical protein FRC08_013688 [Ceratobasidium sp. 394]